MGNKTYRKDKVSSAWVPSSATPGALQAGLSCTGLKDAYGVVATEGVYDYIDKAGEGPSAL